MRPASWPAADKGNRYAAHGYTEGSHRHYRPWDGRNKFWHRLDGIRERV